MKTKLFLAAMSLSALAATGQTGTSMTVKDENVARFKTITVDGLNIFYREAGDKSKPTILLLHGFPSSSHMYRDIINDLSSRYHLVAPDYPGFGKSSAPDVTKYNYTFDNVSVTMEHFIDALQLKNISLYVQDYGGPVGFRIAARRPSLIRSLIIQNANAYTEGLGEAASPLVNYFTTPNAETEKRAKVILASTEWQYTDGAEDVSKISPDSYHTDEFYLARPGNEEIQLTLFRNYGSNLKLYDTWHNYFKANQPATLVIWGKNDKIFIAPGAEAYKKDLKNAEVHLLNGGHFVLEEHHLSAAKLIDSFLSKGLK
ncbi:MAG: alpha/beta hydrolase [Chitinophagaceae bacterium]